jgi:transcriptional regulator with XRE-family HTH domain
LSFVADNIKFSRKLKRLTQAQVADMLGVTRGTIANYETDVSQPPIDTLIKIAKLFDTTVEKLMSNNLANDRLAFCTQCTGNDVQVNDDLVQVSTVLELNEPPSAYGSVSEEVLYLRKRIKQLEQFISQKFPDFPGTPTQ